MASLVVEKTSMREIDRYNASLTYHALEHEVGTEAYYDIVESELPFIVSRKEAKRATGGRITPRILCRDDALNKGPSEMIQEDNVIGYPKEAFIAYLREKLGSHSASDSQSAR